MKAEVPMRRAAVGCIRQRTRSDLRCATPQKCLRRTGPFRSHPVLFLPWSFLDDQREKVSMLLQKSHKRLIAEAKPDFNLFARQIYLLHQKKRSLFDGVEIFQLKLQINGSLVDGADRGTRQPSKVVAAPFLHFFRVDVGALTGPRRRHQPNVELPTRPRLPTFNSTRVFCFFSFPGYSSSASTC